MPTRLDFDAEKTPGEESLPRRPLALPAEVRDPTSSHPASSHPASSHPTHPSSHPQFSLPLHSHLPHHLDPTAPPPTSIITLGGHTPSTPPLVSVYPSGHYDDSGHMGGTFNSGPPALHTFNPNREPHYPGSLAPTIHPAHSITVQVS